MGTIGVVVGPTGLAGLVVPGVLGVLGASVEKPSGRVTPFWVAQVSAGRPSGQQRPLMRQKELSGQGSIRCESVSHAVLRPFVVLGRNRVSG